MEGEGLGQFISGAAPYVKGAWDLGSKVNLNPAQMIALNSQALTNLGDQALTGAGSALGSYSAGVSQGQANPIVGSDVLGGRRDAMTGLPVFNMSGVTPAHQGFSPFVNPQAGAANQLHDMLASDPRYQYLTKLNPAGHSSDPREQELYNDIVASKMMQLRSVYGGDPSQFNASDIFKQATGSNLQEALSHGGAMDTSRWRNEFEGAPMSAIQRRLEQGQGQGDSAQTQILRGGQGPLGQGH
jgi:hypothetical protein